VREESISEFGKGELKVTEHYNCDKGANYPSGGRKALN